MSVFGVETTTDAKRLVRGEHWLAVRSLLRARDGVHSRRWKIATLAGMNPAEEIGSIRSLMPHAVIIAVDRDPRCLSAAIDAGADEVVEVDVFAWEDGYPKVPSAMFRLGDLDALNLDLCGGVTADVEHALRRYRSIIKKGVLLLTFSYGRDVVEVYESRESRYRGIPSPVAARVQRCDRCVQPKRLPPPRTRVYGGWELRSCLAYRGNEMPMCSVLWRWASGDALDLFHRDVAFEKATDFDLALAVSIPEVAALYGLPAERIAALRRSVAAHKAVATRRRNGDLFAKVGDV